MSQGESAHMAVIRGDGTVEFSDENGDWHRDFGLPAVEWANGGREWWVHGKRHRDGDLPAVVRDGSREWWVNGMPHRDGGRPAVVSLNGVTEWWVNGALHRASGPARLVGNSPGEWYLHGDAADSRKAAVLNRLWSGRSHDRDLMRDVPDLVGSDPWLAAVLVANRDLFAALPSRQAAFVSLLASSLR